MIIIIIRFRVPWSVLVLYMNDLSYIWFCLPSQFDTYPVYFYTLFLKIYFGGSSQLIPILPTEKKCRFQAFSKAFFF